MHESIK